VYQYIDTSFHHALLILEVRGVRMHVMPYLWAWAISCVYTSGRTSVRRILG
jgi:hypothetical protein